MEVEGIPYYDCTRTTESVVKLCQEDTRPQCHFVVFFAVWYDRRRKTRLVARGNLTKDPMDGAFAGIRNLHSPHMFSIGGTQWVGDMIGRHRAVLLEAKPGRSCSLSWTGVWGAGVQGLLGPNPGITFAEFLANTYVIWDDHSPEHTQRCR